VVKSRKNQNLTIAESAALREVALSHGYTATRGPLVKNGQESGNAIELLLAIIAGEVATVLLGDEERAHAIGLLEASGDDVLMSIARQLRAAAERERLHDDEELADYRTEQHKQE
jgi:hypothetical protein